MFFKKIFQWNAARVFAFLSGPPDYGAGQLDTRRYGAQYASSGEDAELALLPEQTPFYKDLVCQHVNWKVNKYAFLVVDKLTIITGCHRCSSRCMCWFICCHKWIYRPCFIKVFKYWKWWLVISVRKYRRFNTSSGHVCFTTCLYFWIFKSHHDKQKLN